MNPTRGAVEASPADAPLFWQATDHGEIEEVNFPKAEHSGIIVLEAPAAGYVPVVICRGSQPEIVGHCVAVRLFRDDAFRALMGESSRRPAWDFSKKRFVSEVCDRCNITTKASSLAVSVDRGDLKTQTIGVRR